MSLTHMWVKTILRYPVDIGRARALLEQRQAKASPVMAGRPIVLELSTPQLQFDCGRHLNAILTHARMIESRVYLKCSRLLFAAIARKSFGPDLLSNPNMHWLEPSESIPGGALVLSDRASCRLLPEGDGLTHVRMMIGRDVVPGSLVMPYPMHPHTLETLGAIDFKFLRDQPRRGGIFFAGRMKSNYRNVQNTFGVLTRLEIIECLRSHFAAHLADGVAHLADGGSSNGSEAKIVLVDSAKHPFAPDVWLRALADFDFFVCCPGVAQPMCHNVIEAMSVGTVPLIEYADRFEHPLVDGTNAILFSGYEGLIEAIERIQKLRPSEITKLRHNVIDYYERYLRGDSFLKKLCELPESTEPYTLSMPFHDTNFFSRQNAPQQAA